MATISDGAIAKALNLAGFRGDKVVLFIAIALAESGGDKDIKAGPNRNGTYDHGLLQINDIHRARFPVLWSQRYDPYSNAKMAFAISNGGTDPKPWVAYTTGKHTQYLDRARKAAGNPDAMTGEEGSYGLSDIPGMALGSILSPLKAAGTRMAAFVAGLALAATGGILVASDLSRK